MSPLKEERISLWVNKFKENESSINSIYNFAKDNIGIYREFNCIATNKLIQSYTKVPEIIYIAFLDCITAAGGSELEKTSESCAEVLNILSRFSDHEQLDFKKFMEAFGYKGSDINDFFYYLIGKDKEKFDLPHFRAKKAALFFKILHIIDSIDEKKVFCDYDEYHKKLNYTIALDTVIEEFFNIMLFGVNSNKYEKNGIKKDKIIWKRRNEIINSNTGKDFYNFHEFISRIEYDKEIVESLWFWGYFNTKTREEPYFRLVDFNKPKYITNKFFFPSIDSNFYRLLNQFSEIFKEKFETLN